MGSAAGPMPMSAAPAGAGFAAAGSASGGAYPGGNGSGASRPGEASDDDSKRRGRTKVIAIVAAVVAVLLVIASVGGFLIWRHMRSASNQSTTQSASKPDTTTKPDTTQDTEPKKPVEPAKPKTTEVTMTSFSCSGDTISDWHWEGSALVSDVIACPAGGSSTNSSESSSTSSSDGGDGEYSVGVWTPAFDQSKEIHVSMLESGEKEYSEPKVAATYGDNPAVFVIYAVKTKAVGTTPESVHLYAHEVDMKNGTIGKRIDLRTEADNLINYEQDYDYTVLGASNATVAVAKTWHTDMQYNVNGGTNTLEVGHTQVMGLTRNQHEATTLQTFQDVVANNEEGYPEVTTERASNVTMQDVYMVSGTSYRLYSIDANKQITSFGNDFCPGNSDGWGCNVKTIRHVGGDIYAIGAEWNSFILDTANGKARYMAEVIGHNDADTYNGNISWDQFSDGTLYILDRSSVSNEIHVYLLDKNLKKTEVLDSDQWNRLLLGSGEFNGINYLTKRIYVKTTDQQIMVDEKGDSTGEYTRLPAEGEDAECDHNRSALDHVVIT